MSILTLRNLSVLPVRRDDLDDSDAERFAGARIAGDEPFVARPALLGVIRPEVAARAVDLDERLVSSALSPMSFILEVP